VTGGIRVRIGAEAQNYGGCVGFGLARWERQVRECCVFLIGYLAVAFQLYWLLEGDHRCAPTKVWRLVWLDGFGFSLITRVGFP
jgi:hypothetical protein